jgi:PAS domain-containing protein
MMIEAIPVALYLTDDYHTKVEYVNPYFTELTGYTLEDVPTISDWNEKAYPDTSYRSAIFAETMSNLEKSLANGKPFIEMRSTVTCKNGIQKQIQWKQAQIDHKGLGCGIEIKDDD